MSGNIFRRVLVTGGGGFIGSSYIHNLISLFPSADIQNIDSQTYACSSTTLNKLDQHSQYSYSNIDICDADAVQKVIDDFLPDLVVHFAAESHVDNSIKNPNSFINTNIIGTTNLLNAINNCPVKEKVLFHHISTDEVYGDLTFDEAPFSESSPIKPSSPYSASKASADLMVQAWSRTYGLNYLITNCSNNFGPRQHPEKLIPKSIFSLINQKKVTIYGDGQNVRDWIFVDDHTNILLKLQESNLKNTVFNVGGKNEISNLKLVSHIIEHLSQLGINILDEPIEFIDDRLGHDRRYAINNTYLEQFVSSEILTPFDSSLHRTVTWYLENQDWWN